MKRLMMCIGLVVLLALGLLALDSKAQAQTRVVMTANVPFEFNIGNSHFSSGKLVIQKVASDVFMGTNGKAGAIFHAIPSLKLKRDPTLCTLHFRAYGGHYFLSEVWEGTEGHQLHKSPTEIKLAKAMEAQAAEVSAVGK